jgi:uncharacterized YkwD family protein
MKYKKLLFLTIPLLIVLFFFGVKAIGDHFKEEGKAIELAAASHSAINNTVKKMPEDVLNNITFFNEREAQRIKEEEERLRLEQERIEKERLEQERIKKEEEKKRKEEQERLEEQKSLEEEKNNQQNEASQETEQPTLEPKTEWNYPGISSFEREVVKYTNIERVKHGLTELKIDSKLSEVAWYKSKDMQVNGYFSHNSPTYGSPFEMMISFGVNYTAAGENIAYGFNNAEQLVTGWMNSEGHRRNILNGTYTHIGVGFVQEGNYSTQMFLRK